MFVVSQNHTQTNNPMIIYNKYIKYKNKYKNLQSEIMSGGRSKSKSKKSNTGEKYSCDTTNKYKDICSVNGSGVYNSLQACKNDCKIRYITAHLKKSDLNQEVQMYQGFVNKLLEMDIEVYIKGGTTMGLKLLQMIYRAYPDNRFEKYLYKFLEMDLIKDWDFACYTKKPIDKETHEKFIKLAKKYNLVSRASLFVLFQAKRPIEESKDKILFEIGINEKFKLSSMELPLTTMKIKINKYNIKNIFMFALCFYNYKKYNIPFDIDLVKELVTNIHVDIFKYRDGLFKYDDKMFDTGNIHGQLLDLIMEYKNININYPQLLISLTSEPNRIFFRLVEKNIPKNDSMKDFINKNKIDKNVSWLIDSKEILDLVEGYLKKLSKFMTDTYSKNKLTQCIELIDEFYQGVVIRKVKLDFKYYKSTGIKLLKIWIGPLYDLIGVKNINKLYEELLDKKLNLVSRENSIVDLLYFISQQEPPIF